MTRLGFSVSLLLILLTVSPATAQLSDGPDHVILVNQLDGIIYADGCILGLTTKGLVSYYFDDEDSLFVLADWLFFAHTDAYMKRSDDRLAVCTDDSLIHLIDISSLPELNYIGEVEFDDEPFSDFAVKGDDIYLAKWFDGVWRYNITPGFEAVFADSSMMGIYCTKVEVFDDSLYVLDEYNGLMQYDLSVDGFGDFIDYLYVPRRATSFFKYDSAFCLLLATTGAYIGDFYEDGAEIVDSLTEFDDLIRCYYSDSLLLLLSEDYMYLVNRSDLESQDTIALGRYSVDGAQFLLGDTDYMALAYADGGVTLFNLDQNCDPSAALFRAGTISDLLIYEDQLAVAGQGRPIDLYTMIDTTDVEYNYTLYESYQRASGLLNNGDSLFVLSNTLNSVFLIDNFNNPDSFAIVNGFSVSVGAVKDLQYIPNSVDGKILMLAVGEYDIDVFRVVPDSGFIERVAEWTFSGYDIQMAAARNDAVHISANKGSSILSYRITSSYTLNYLGGAPLYSEALRSKVFGDTMYVFQASVMHVFDISNPDDIFLEAIVDLPYLVSDAQVYDNHLYTVSSEGISVFNLAETQPMLVDTIPFGATSMAVDNGVLAVSDGNGVYFFVLEPTGDPNFVDQFEGLPEVFSLDQNYPNPFNLETTISFDLKRRSLVTLKIYNILGQEVITLVDETIGAGRHSVSWNGRTQTGEVVATGLYLYRLQTDESSATRKMLLLK